ncbi:pyrophosphatase ppax [Colletotrichum plurivorum]|uniref:Pyrophosphatase ppax n=1 Tax=Colletotrichum plurivorum TaxID=2175906 RepID=A0A8H6NC56_9PEZI|nr:pyrophosphatase ppax [Colletotrichum plurivorum]
MISLVIFDFDGTLFDTHASIEETTKLTFDSLLPSSPQPPAAEVRRLISSGAGLSDTFRALYPDPAVFDEASDTIDRWIAEYRRLYAQERSQSLIRPFPGAKDLLSYLRHSLKVPVAIISNKGVQAVRDALHANGLADYVPEDLIVGDKTPGATRKPDPGSFTDVLVPALRKAGYYGAEEVVGASKVLVVGDTVADIQFARNIGADACWARYGYGDRAKCEELGPNFTVEELFDVIGIIQGKEGES